VLHKKTLDLNLSESFKLERVCLNAWLRKFRKRTQKEKTITKGCNPYASRSGLLRAIPNKTPLAVEPSMLRSRSAVWEKSGQKALESLAIGQAGLGQTL